MATGAATGDGSTGPVAGEAGGSGSEPLSVRAGAVGGCGSPPGDATVGSGSWPEAQSLAPGGGADCVCARALATASRRIRALGAKAPW